jgi:hypothetical protein
MQEPGHLLPPLQCLLRTQALRNTASSGRASLPNDTVLALQLDERETVKGGCPTVFLRIALNLSTADGQTTTLASSRKTLASVRLNTAIG